MAGRAEGFKSVEVAGRRPASVTALFARLEGRLVCFCPALEEAAWIPDGPVWISRYFFTTGVSAATKLEDELVTLHN